MAEEPEKTTKSKRVGEIMIPIEEYPKIRENASLVEAMQLMKEAELVVGGRKSLPRLLVVTDEQDRLVGMVRRRDILRGLEPKFLRSRPLDDRKQLFGVEIDPNLLEMSTTMIVEGIRKRAVRSVRTVMFTDIVTIDYDDHFMKAIYEMVTHDITSLPVIKNGEVVGIVRTVELFNEIVNFVVDQPA